MNTTYQILNQSLCFADCLEYQAALQKFLSADSDSFDFILKREEPKSFSNIWYEKDLPFVYGIQYRSGKEPYQIFFSQKDPRQFLSAEKEDYSNVHLYLQEPCSRECFMKLLMAGFYSYISLKHALLMHASAVSYREQAIVFTAPSGTGKTTQAELWQKYRDAVILNGDKVFLKQEKDGIHAWGSPWKGSSPYAENQSAPLSAIIVLEQAKENRIRRLSGLELLEKVIPHLFLPQWDTRCETAVLQFLDEVLKKTEIYLFQCRPDEEAVTLVEKIVFETGRK